MTPQIKPQRHLQEDLMIFMQAYGGVKVSVYQDMLVYKVTPGYGKKAAFNAGIILKDLGMDDRLEAIPADWLSNDSFSIVEKNKTAKNGE
jgi:hypothetical protein